MFAYREAPQESTTFSNCSTKDGPGTMTILRELWENEKSDDEFVESYQYVVDLRNRIESTCEMARENLKDSKDRYKKHYDRKAKVRS